MSIRPAIRSLALSATLAASSALAADITLTPPSGGGVAITNAAGNATQLRVTDDGATLTGNLALDGSTATTGNILKSGLPFIHDFGAFNTFIGRGAGNFTLSGQNNTSSGLNTLSSDTSGGGNTASGVNALILNTTGNDNTAMGRHALYSNDGGASNTACGAFALLSNTSGSNNIAVGYNAGVNLTTGSHNIHVGNIGSAAEDNTIRVGDSQTRTFIAGIRGVTTGSLGAVPVLIDGFGQLGTISSSRRFKDDIADMAESSSGLMKLRPVTFHYKSDHNPAGRSLQYGLIAEEVAEVYPGLVAHSNDGKIETVMYQFLAPMLLNEYQKQQRRIDGQTALLTRQAEHIAELERERQAQAAQIAGLQQSMARMVATMDRLQRNATVTAGREMQ